MARPENILTARATTENAPATAIKAGILLTTLRKSQRDLQQAGQYMPELDGGSLHLPPFDRADSTRVLYIIGLVLS
jgi:hypothetical protein